MRDYVLGASLLNGRAEVLSFGGQVMKNVAGYDVSRLLAGSMGVLGVVLEVSLKVLPMAPATATLRFQMDQVDALDRLNLWGAQPLPLNASAWWDGALKPLAKTHPHCVLQPQENTYGMLLYSRLPLIDPQVSFLVEDDVPSIHTRVRLRSGCEVRLHCLHPRPPAPAEADSLRIVSIRISMSSVVGDDASDCADYPRSAGCARAPEPAWPRAC